LFNPVKICILIIFEKLEVKSAVVSPDDEKGKIIEESCREFE
jgi:hypothetical protein